ncbi:hypothetical protein AQUCO_04000043v1 [Aquilegia coerulea]|uniref:S-protein homolog n=1 Tax=Aquilegia coerulea TaxID=218851 RepID=A0A2G5CR20_AQUCA|nr:hypothetical protein AQUCO_04000043v1 [Aquilegia coerulea]
MSTIQKVALMFILVVVIQMHSSYSGFVVNMKRHVSIANGLGPSNTLTVHCRSKDTDLGERNVAYGQTYEWTFRDNLLESTLYWCCMWWYNHHELVWGNFEVHHASSDGHTYCQNIVKRAQWDGLYYQLPDKFHNWVKKYEWTRGKQSNPNSIKAVFDNR